MDCQVIFYAAHKTSFCEKALKRCLPPLNLRVSGACFANGAEHLGNQLIAAFEGCDVCFIIGGLAFGDSRSVAAILSNAAADSEPELLRRLPNQNGDDGLLLRAGSQLLAVLPDEPAQIEDMLRGVLGEYLKKSVTEEM